MIKINHFFKLLLLLCFLVCAILYYGCDDNDSKNNSQNCKIDSCNEDNTNINNNSNIANKTTNSNIQNNSNSNSGNISNNSSVEPECVSDEECDQDKGESCVNGICAFKCQQNYHCNHYFPDGTHYCDPELGYCIPSKNLCDSCETDIECQGDGSLCIAYPSGGNYCGILCGQRGCPAGYFCNQGNEEDYGVGQCLPNSRDCTDVGMCLSNDDCELGFICKLETGACVPKCIYDRYEGTMNCPPGQICHITGECGLPCISNTDCGGGDFICESEEGRCTVDGCVDSMDCPPNTYCETSTHKCLNGCQTETDCQSGFKCEENECVEMNCVERGGAALKCDLNQFCCGENSDIECSSEVQVGDCFDAFPPYCQGCDASSNDNSQCGGTSFEVDNLCVEVEDDQGNKTAFCIIGCRDTKDCPRGHQCQEVTINEDGTERTQYNCIWPGCVDIVNGTQ